MTNIGFIGAGNMGSAIIKGILCSEAGKTSKVFAFDPSSDKLAELEKLGVTSCTSECDVMKNCKYVFLAVKPQVIEGVLETIAPCTIEDTVIVSIAAGISDEFIAKKTIPSAKVVLVMPNTPLLLGEGASRYLPFMRKGSSYFQGQNEGNNRNKRQQSCFHLSFCQGIHRLCEVRWY